MPHVIPTLLHDAAPAAEQVIMTLAEQWKAEGEAKGETRGEVRGLREVLVRLLVLKFGSISAGDQARIDTAAKDELLQWSERVLSADSPAAVLNG